MKEIKAKIKSRPVLIQDGSEIDFPILGQKYVLFFYPKDSTPTCTVEACSLRDGYEDIKKLGYEIIGVSIDSVALHQKFIANNELPFPLISDDKLKLVKEFGVWAEKSMYGKKYMGILRTTFIIDESSKISHIIAKVKSKEAAQQVLDFIQV